MAMPAGARNVAYSISQYGSGAEIDAKIVFDLGISAGLVEQAAQAAMGAFVAKLVELTPDAPVNASRTYDLNVPGDPWRTTREA
jgi:hypothetical protein